MLRVKGLTKKFGKKVANENVNLSLEAGEIGVLLGPNGAGKSTAIKCILGLLHFDGTVKIGGFPANLEVVHNCAILWYNLRHVKVVQHRRAVQRGETLHASGVQEVADRSPCPLLTYRNFNWRRS